MAWLRYAATQLLMLVALLVGALLILPLPCALQAWTAADTPSINLNTPGRKVDRFTWPINWVYGNPEDGVSGQQAVVRGQSYLPQSGPRWRAYSWSALRNSVGGLKYQLAWSQGTLLVDRTYGNGHTIKLGWQNENGFRVPVLSLW